jgi:peptide/nickel transport system permease protein
MSLRSYLLKRALYTVVLIFFVIILNWVIFEAMPGVSGNLYAVLGQHAPGLGDKQYQQQIALYGLDKPYWTRFYDYVKAMLTFQFGFSYASNQDVTAQMINSGKLANTLLLLGASTAMAIIVGTVLGIVVARKRGSTLDNFWVTTSLTTFSLPTFFMGILLIFVFAIALNWFPSGGTHPNSWDNLSLNLKPQPFEQYLVRLQYLFLPALTLTLFAYGGFLLLTRATMMEALSEDYILTARAKGLTERAVLFKHAFKNASLPIITSSALAFGGILGGAIITETIFNWDGLGKWLYDSIGYKDFPVMQAMFYIIALSVIAANFVSDILYGIVDPRIKYE